MLLCVHVDEHKLLNSENKNIGLGSQLNREAYLLCKNENLNLRSYHPHKKLHIVSHVCNLRIVGQKKQEAGRNAGMTLNIWASFSLRDFSQGKETENDR